MKITAIVEKPEGNYEFTANLTEEQHRFLIEYAIRDMMTKGLLPFDSRHTPDTDVIIHPDFEEDPGTQN